METRTSETTAHGQKNGGESGFTLVELLAAIAIIAVLAVLLFGMGSKILKDSQKMATMNNMRQIGVALLAYTAEYDGRLPKPYLTQRPNMENGFLAKDLAPYLGVKVEERRVNPYFADAAWMNALGLGKEQLLGTDRLPTRFRVNRWTQDGMRFFPWGSRQAVDKTEPYKLIMISNVSSAWAIQEVDSKITGTESLEEPLWGTERLALFFDGSVKSIPVDAFWTGPTPPTPPAD
jgi:prepilin-type N-terminal cleavage/methylation domain-containing protein